MKPEKDALPEGNLENNQKIESLFLAVSDQDVKDLARKEAKGTIAKLMSSVRFLPLFITQFLTSFNDNFFKNAVIALLTYGIISQQIDKDLKEYLVIIAGAAFVLPYFLFSATAGKMADKVDRIKAVRIIKIIEICMMLLGAVGFITNNLYVLFGTLFLLGVHSTVFSPVKFGILPTYLHKHELVAGNAMIEGATFLAIVSGIIAGTQIILIEPIGHYITSISLIILAITGYISCLRMPRVRPNSPNIKIGWNIFAHTYEILADMWHNKEVTKYVLSSGWFWFVAAVLVTIFPLYVSDVLYLNKNVYTLILVIFAVGVGIGSTLCSVFLKGIISAKYTPVAAIIMGIFAIDLGFQSQPFHTIPAQGLVADLLADVRGWRILFDFAAIAIGGGFYVVPFFALIQDRSPKEAKSRMIAASNIVNAAFMVSAAGFMFVAKHIGLDLPETLIVIGGMGLTGALIVHIITPDSVLRFKKKE